MRSNHLQVAAAQTDDGQPVAELIARYRAGFGILEESLRGLDSEQLLARPVPGRMSTLEVLAHVTDCEQFLADRMKRTIAMDRPLLVGADGWLYPEALSYQRRDVQLELDVVRTTRAQMAWDLEALGPDAWDRVAVHTETGLVTLRQLLVHTVRHLEWHVETIREKRVAMGLDT